MKSASTFVLGLVLLAVSSCATERVNLKEMQPILYKIHYDSVMKLEEDQKAFAQKVETYMANDKVWNQKYDVFINSLSNEELQALSDLREAYNQGGKPKSLLARRKLEALLKESMDSNKLVTFKRLSREAGELVQPHDALDTQWQQLEKRRKQLEQQKGALEEMRRTIEEERQRKEMLSAIKGIGSSLDSLRFNLDQWKMQQWLWGR